MLNPINCIVWLIVGGLAGTVAGRLIRGKGYGLVGDVGLGLVGSIVGNFVLGLLGLGATGLLGGFVASAVGAVIFVLAIRVFVDSKFAG